MFFFFSFITPVFVTAEDEDFVVWNMLSDKDIHPEMMQWRGGWLFYGVLLSFTKSVSFNAVNHIVLQYFSFYFSSCF